MYKPHPPYYGAKRMRDKMLQLAKKAAMTKQLAKEISEAISGAVSSVFTKYEKDEGDSSSDDFLPLPKRKKKQNLLSNIISNKQVMRAVWS